MIPTLNEAEHITSVIRALSAPMAHDGLKARIWIVDGLSSDGTATIVRNLKLKHVSIIENPHRTQAHAMNLAAKRAQELGDIDVLVRVDAHARYTCDFLPTVMKALTETGAESVVVPLETIGGTRIQNAAAILFQSWMGNGGSPHRTGTSRGMVEHGHHAAIRLDAYVAVGGYDTDFLANEDAEFDHRLISSGRRIFLENKVSIGYIPRATLTETFHQYRRNGTYRIRRAIKHRLPLGLRQALPAILLPVLIINTILAALVSPFFLLVLAGYAISVIISSFIISKHRGQTHLFYFVAALAAASHLGFSLGASGEFLRCCASSTRRQFLRNDKDRLLTKTISRGA